MPRRGKAACALPRAVCPIPVFPAAVLRLFTSQRRPCSCALHFQHKLTEPACPYRLPACSTSTSGAGRKIGARSMKCSPAPVACGPTPTPAPACPCPCIPLTPKWNCLPPVGVPSFPAASMASFPAASAWAPRTKAELLAGGRWGEQLPSSCGEAAPMHRASGSELSRTLLMRLLSTHSTLRFAGGSTVRCPKNFNTPASTKAHVIEVGAAWPAAAAAAAVSWRCCCCRCSAAATAAAAPLLLLLGGEGGGGTELLVLLLLLLPPRLLVRHCCLSESAAAALATLWFWLLHRSCAASTMPAWPWGDRAQFGQGRAHHAGQTTCVRVAPVFMPHRLSPLRAYPPSAHCRSQPAKRPSGGGCPTCPTPA